MIPQQYRGEYVPGEFSHAVARMNAVARAKADGSRLLWVVHSFHVGRGGTYILFQVPR